MKKITILTLVLLLFASATRVHAQFDKHTWMLLGYSSLWYEAGKEKFKQDDQSIDGAKFMNLYLRTGAGLFVMQRLAAGIYLNWEYEREKNEDDFEGTTTQTTNYFYAGPFLRYYFLTLQRFAFYGEAMVAFGVYKSVFEGIQTSESKDNLLRAHFLVGSNYFLTRAIALDLAFGYALNRYKDPDSDYINSYNHFMACLGIVFFLGQNAGLSNYEFIE